MEAVRIDKMTNEEYIKICEIRGLIDITCNMCQEVFYPALSGGKAITDVFAPNHKANERCQSGKHNHCTCDTCF